jgi:hypothetical protein
MSASFLCTTSSSSLANARTMFGSSSSGTFSCFVMMCFFSSHFASRKWQAILMRDLIKRARKRVFYFETRKSRGVSERYFTRNRIARRRILTHRVLVRRGYARDERGIHARAFASPRCRRPYLKPLVSLFLKIY